MEDAGQTEQNLPEEGGAKVEMKVEMKLGGALVESSAGTPCRMAELRDGGTMVDTWQVEPGG